jgi:RNA polymerase sigma factor (sigma-70 family)
MKRADMTSRSLSAALPHLRRLLAAGADEPGDQRLLEHFVRRGDEEAFASLVRRHGPMVLAVCRRLLADPHDAEDAFQATFLVLVRKASSVGRPERLGNWLYGVAYRVAVKLRSQNARRHRREQPFVDVPAGDVVADLVWRELRSAIDEELYRLPEKYRVPIVLCYLEGVSKRAAARRLGWPEGTLSTRLHRARLMLRERLGRRGLGLSAGVVAVALTQGAAPAAVPSILAAATAMSLVVPGRAGLVPAPVAALAEGVVRAMWWSKLKVIAAVLLAAGLLAAGLGGAALHSHGAPTERDEKAANSAPEPPKKEANGLKTFHLGKKVREVVWSPDGKLMASRATRTEKKDGGDEDTVDWYTTVKVWDAASGKEIVSLGELKNSGLVAVGFAPDSVTLALSFFRQIEEGAKVELWDARKGELKKTIKMDYGRSPPKFAFSPDGKVLAVLDAGDKDRDPKTSDLSGGARLFDPGRGTAVLSLRGHKHMAISLAFSPDGKLLATGGSQHDNDVRLWDVTAGKEHRVIKTGAIVHAVTFSRDGKVLATGQGDGRVVLWDVATGKELRVLAGATDSALRVAFSPEGRLLAAAGPVERDGKRPYGVRLWSAAAGKLLRSWDDTGASVGFSPDGKMIAILGKDGTVRLWPLRGLVKAADPNADYGFGKLIDRLIKDRKTDDEAVTLLFVAALGRYPEERERKLLTDHLAKKQDRREAMIDVVWALINSKEYLSRLDVLTSNDPRKKLKQK